jgi:hypothetical protein
LSYKLKFILKNIGLIVSLGSWAKEVTKSYLKYYKIILSLLIIKWLSQLSGLMECAMIWVCYKLYKQHGLPPSNYYCKVKLKLFSATIIMIKTLLMVLIALPPVFSVYMIEKIIITHNEILIVLYFGQYLNLYYEKCII